MRFFSLLASHFCGFLLSAYFVFSRPHGGEFLEAFVLSAVIYFWIGTIVSVPMTLVMVVIACEKRVPQFLLWLQIVPIVWFNHFLANMWTVAA